VKAKTLNAFPFKNIVWKSEAGDVPFQENIARVRKGRASKDASGFRSPASFN
jgi:hypothetical protein